MVVSSPAKESRKSKRLGPLKRLGPKRTTSAVARVKVTVLQGALCYAPRALFPPIQSLNAAPVLYLECIKLCSTRAISLSDDAPSWRLAG